MKSYTLKITECDFIELYNDIIIQTLNNPRYEAKINHDIIITKTISEDKTEYNTKLIITE